MFKVDYHIHTRLSPCAAQEMSVENILERENDQNMEVIAFTDHCYSFEYSIKNVSRVRLSVKEITSQMIKEERISKSMRVLFGVEAEILEYRYVSITPELAGEFDFVLVAPNHYHSLNTFFNLITPTALAINELYNFQAAVKNPATDAIAHPFLLRPQIFGMTKDEMAEFSRRMMEKLNWKELAETLEMAAQRGIGVELTPRFIVYKQTHLLDFYSLCLEKGIKFLLGSDSHSLGELSRLDLLDPIIDQLGITEEDLWHPHEWEW
jgi:histidinol phosphatase-like PHP family hydrolase